MIAYIQQTAYHYRNVIHIFPHDKFQAVLLVASYWGYAFLVAHKSLIIQRLEHKQVLYALCIGKCDNRLLIASYDFWLKAVSLVTCLALEKQVLQILLVKFDIHVAKLTQNAHIHKLLEHQNLSIINKSTKFTPVNPLAGLMRPRRQGRHIYIKALLTLWFWRFVNFATSTIC